MPKCIIKTIIYHEMLKKQQVTTHPSDFSSNSRREKIPNIFEEPSINVSRKNSFELSENKFNTQNLQL